MINHLHSNHLLQTPHHVSSALFFSAPSQSPTYLSTTSPPASTNSSTSYPLLTVYYSGSLNSFQLLHSSERSIVMVLFLILLSTDFSITLPVAFQPPNDALLLFHPFLHSPFQLSFSSLGSNLAWLVQDRISNQ